MSTFILAACGSSNSSKVEQNKETGFLSDYIPPESNFDTPDNVDPNFKVLEPVFVDPYWVSALEMDDGQSVIGQILLDYDRSLYFSFPSDAPDYLPVTITGWLPANEHIQSASREIFAELEKVLDINFQESDLADGLNNVVIARSIQANTSGFAYFPNNYYQIGSDVFIAKEYSKPIVLSNNYTSYDYEVLVHEIGHALGLKHPFEEDRNNLSVLNDFEDQTKFTVMSYDHNSSTFDGTYRSLDWMTLTKLYGVNPEFNADDNIYMFDDKTGKFIIDGNGIDTVISSGSAQNVFIDLRPGSHSYEGLKSGFITAAKQLTISHGSEIENVHTGSGEDTVVGNSLPNIIETGIGNDIIFSGDGADQINSGPGKDMVDLSEDVEARDVIRIEKYLEEGHYDMVYGFSQGDSGDAFDITDFRLPGLAVLPIVDVLNVPRGWIDNCLVRVFGDDLTQSDSLFAALQNTGVLENLKLSTGEDAFMITAASQSTGEDQNLYYLQQNLDYTEVHHLTQLVGNYLDIDNWSADNFVI